MKIILLVIAVAAVLAVVGCAYRGPKTEPGPGSTLINTYWKLLSIDGVALDPPTGPKEAHFILRPDYRVTGFGGCNTFNGSWEKQDDEVLALGPLMSTRMACPEMGIEHSFLAAMDGEIATAVAGELLTVIGSNGTELVFQAMYFQ